MQANASTMTDKARLPPTTLTYLLQDDAVPFDELYARHGAVSSIAKTLLGVKPNTGKFYEIWPPANKMYYFMVPAFLNLPAYLFGFGAPKNLVSLALYASSLAAGCPYCTSHTCTFAVRRGVDAKKLSVEALEARDGDTSALFTDAERAVIDVAEQLAVFPCKLTNAQRRALVKHTGDAATAEATVLGMAMMGYLNKGMDALGMPLEVETYRETRDIIGPSWSAGSSGQLVDPVIHTAEAAPPTDGLSTYWEAVMGGPSGASFESKAVAGLPDDGDEASAFLRERYGYEYPVLKAMHNKRGMIAITVMIDECFRERTSVIGIRAKVAVGQIFATITESKPAQEAIAGLAAHNKVDAAFVDKAVELARASEPIEAAQKLYDAPEDSKLQALLVIAHASSWSPARISDTTIRYCEAAKLEPAAIVEVVAIVSVLQMLHRISMFYRFDDEKPAQNA